MDTEQPYASEATIHLALLLLCPDFYNSPSQNLPIRIFSR